MPNIIEWSIPGFDNQPIYGNTHTPESGAEAATGVMLIAHGFKGYKDYGFLPQLAEAAARVGLIAHRFNSSHSGMTNNIDTFERPELFEIDTWRKQSADLNTVIHAVRSGTIVGEGLPITLFGHSRGGVTTLLAAGDPNTCVSEELAGVITAAAPSACSRLDTDTIEMLKRVGKIASPSSRTGQTLYVGRIWQDEIDAAPAWHDPCRAIAEIRCPVMLIHGTDDTTVPVADAESLQAARPDAEYTVIPGAGHTFNAPNPLPLDQSAPSETQQMIEAASGFAVRCCRQIK